MNFDPLNKSVVSLAQAASKILQITRLRFPAFRNISPDEVLDFTHPITCLLGANGSNKSSVLHAIYGSADGQSVADFWFETKLDAIPDLRDGLKQSVVHEYPWQDGVRTSIKARAPRGSTDPDYWEAVKPTGKYGFEKGAKRSPPVPCEIKHLDFRGQLPAFDKYFYFPDEKHLEARKAAARSSPKKLRRNYRKQDYLRGRSSQVLNRLNSEGSAFTDEEIAAISYIVGTPYVSGTYLYHSLYRGHSGWLVRFGTEIGDLEYSDAFAGSGEAAAAILVRNVLSSKGGSVLLLDEPETSLHPRAQRKLMQVLCHYALRRRLQIVIATHSIHFTESLPVSCIRVLRKNSNGQIEIRGDITAREAVYELDEVDPSGKIFVEDVRAKHILDTALKTLSASAASVWKVEVAPGGVASIYHDIAVFAARQINHVAYVLDGDQHPDDPVPADGQLPSGDKELDLLIRKLTAGNDQSGPKLNLKTGEEKRRFLGFLRDRVFYLPGETPEASVWDDEVLETVSTVFNVDLSSLLSAAKEVNHKERIEAVAKLIPGFTGESFFQLLTSRSFGTSKVLVDPMLQLVDQLRKLD